MGRKKHIETLSRVLIVDRTGRVLLCRNKKGNYYYLPGGHVEFGEGARQAAERELMEECGLEVATGELMLVSENQFGERKDRVHEYTMVFGGRVKSKIGRVQSREAYIDFEWLTREEIGKRDVRPDSIQKWLRNGSGRGTKNLDFVSEGL